MRGTAKLALVLSACLVVFVGGNGYDYWNYHRSWNIEKDLGEDGLARLAELCTEWETRGHIQYSSEAELPPEFRFLGALWGSISPGSSQFGLYKLQAKTLEKYFFSFDVWMNVETTSLGQSITVSNHDFGGRRSKKVWDNYPPSEPQLDNRIVTVSEWQRGRFQSWIVYPDRIEIHYDTLRSGSENEVLSIISVTPKQRSELEATVHSIPSETRGRHHKANMMDGISLSIHFSLDGSINDTRIEVSNIWIDEIGPLLDLIDANVEGKYSTSFRSHVTPSWEEEMKPKLEVTTWEEERALERKFIQPPWWCVWRKIPSLKPTGLR